MSGPTIDRIADEFESDWGHGEPSVGSYLERVAPEERAALFAELLRVDVAIRKVRGRERARHWYREAYPEYAAIIKEALGGAIIDAPSGDSPASAHGGTATARRGYPEEIGPYRLLDRLGEGAMGQVFLAEQRRPMQRRVALKLIKLGMDTEEVVARFEAERQALALMDHPSIARVFDAGSTADGRPYFVMEYVRGRPLTEYCARHRLSVEERLRLFVQISRGVQHAHQRGIIHRDLKPSNIIVGREDDAHVPKIIDFGVARATHRTFTGKAVYTRIGCVVGTPAYMSPEQAGLEAVDQRADIFALGVILYELVVGELPYDGDLSKTALGEVLRWIREEDPPAPSQRWARLSLERTAELARQRRCKPAALSDRLRGDLDCIILKAMAREAARRYSSAAELADDVERHLRGDPILARPPTMVYVLSKLVRKHRGLAFSILSATLALVLGLAVSLALYVRAEDARRRTAEALADIQRERAGKEAALEGQRRALEARERALDEVIRMLSKEYAGNLASYLAGVAAGNFGGSKRHLEQCREELRGWEWGYCALQADPSLATLTAHEGEVVALAFCGNMSLVSASRDGAIVVWRTSDHRPLRRIATGTEISALDAAVTAESGAGTVAWSAGDGVVRLFETATPEAMRELRGHRKPVRSVAFSRDGRYLVSASLDGTVRLWSARDGLELHVFRVNPATAPGVACAVFSHGDTRIVSASDEHFTLKVWDLATKERVSRKNSDYLTSLAVHPEGSLLVGGAWDAFVRAWRAPAGEEIRLAGHGRNRINDVAFSPDGAFFVSAGTDDTLRLWDAQSLTLRATLTGHGRQVLAVAISPDSTLIASGSADHSVKLWDARTRGPMAQLVGHRGRVYTVGAAARSGQVVSGSEDGTVRVWSALGEELAVLRGHNAAVSSVSVNARGDRIVSGSDDGTIRVWNERQGAWESGDPLTAHSASLNAVALDADGGFFVSGSDDGSVRGWRWNGHAWASFEIGGHRSTVNAVALSHDGLRVVSGSGSREDSRDNSVRLWDVGEPALLRVLPNGHAARVRTVTFSPDAAYVASGSEDETVRVWRTEGGEPPRVLRSSAARIQSITFSPDGTRCVAAGDQEVKIWETSTWNEVVTLRNEKNRVYYSAAFSADGKRLVLGSADKSVWILESEKDRAVALWHAEERRRVRFVKGLVEEYRTRDEVLAALEGRGFALSEEFKAAARVLVERLHGQPASGAAPESDRREE